MFKFPWTRNAEELGSVEIQVKERIGKLENEVKTLKQRSTDAFSAVENLGDAVFKRIEENDELYKNSYETARLIAEKARSVADDLEKRLSNLESKIKQGDAEAYKNMVDQFIANFERMNDNFERGMETLISQSANTNRYLVDMAGKKISEVTELLGGIRVEDQSSTWEIIINAKAYDVDKKEVSYRDILALMFDSAPPEEVEFSMDFRNSAEVEKRDGKLQDGDSIAIENGTIFMVTRSDLA